MASAYSKRPWRSKALAGARLLPAVGAALWLAAALAWWAALGMTAARALAG